MPKPRFRLFIGTLCTVFCTLSLSLASAQDSASTGSAEHPLAALDLTNLPVLILEHDDTVIESSVMVVIPDGLVIEDWTHHGALSLSKGFTVEQASNWMFVVEHFELDGYAVLGACRE
jgi:hypothetical protein